MYNYLPITVDKIIEIERLFTKLDREREGLLDQPKIFFDIKIQVPTAVKFIVINNII